jgi:hypothetical protein
VEQARRRRQGRGWHQRFTGFRARINCESVPVIPAWLIRTKLDDPRNTPYLLVWKRERDGEIRDVVRLGHYFDSHGNCVNSLIELKRTDGSATDLRIIWRTLPRNGGRALFLVCNNCVKPRRFIYGSEWSTSSGSPRIVRRTSWRCRECCQLRYTSEGGFLRPSKVFRAFGNYDRPELWLPYVFTSLQQAAEANFGPLW